MNLLQFHPLFFEAKMMTKTVAPKWIIAANRRFLLFKKNIILLRGERSRFVFGEQKLEIEAPLTFPDDEEERTLF